LWSVAISWSIGGNTTPSTYFNLWLKSLKNANGKVKYSVAMLNYLPIIGQAIQLVAQHLDHPSKQPARLFRRLVYELHRSCFNDATLCLGIHKSRR
jgi:hypothetical protein